MRGALERAWAAGMKTLVPPLTCRCRDRAIANIELETLRSPLAGVRCGAVVPLGRDARTGVLSHPRSPGAALAISQVTVGAGLQAH